MADRPRLVIQHNILDITGKLIAGLHLITHNRLCAPEVTVHRLPCRWHIGPPLALEGLRALRQDRKAAHSPQPVAHPVIRPAVILVILLFILLRYGLMRFDRWAVLDLLASQVHQQNFPALIQAPHSMWRDRKSTRLNSVT